MTRMMTATPVLRCADYPKARAFYCGVLGFSVVEEGGLPPRFGILERDGARIFLDAWHGPPFGPQSGWSAYVNVEGLDAFHAAVVAGGLPELPAPEAKPYGMRELELRDLDGNLLCFGEALPST